MAFAYRDGVLCAEEVPLEDIARRFGTPCYVYSRAAIERAYREFDRRARRARPRWSATRSRPTPTSPSCTLLARLGAGFDIVSGGELARVLAAGGDPRKVVFSGVGKTEDEIAHALRAGHPLLQRRVGGGARARSTAIAGAARQARAGRVPRQSRRRRRRRIPYISTGLQGEQVRHRLRRRAERLYRDAARAAGISRSSASTATSARR